MDQLTSRQIQAIKTRRKIFNKATNLFMKTPYEKVKIIDICNAADVSVGAFYHYFNSKEDIINEGYNFFDDIIRAKWKDYEKITPFDSICFLISNQFIEINKSGSLHATNFFKYQLTNEDKYILNKDRFFYITLHNVVAEAINNNEIQGNPEKITDLILRISRGIIYDWCLHEGSYDLVEQGVKDIICILQNLGF